MEMVRGRVGERMESIHGTPEFSAHSNQGIKLTGGTIQLLSDST